MHACGTGVNPHRRYLEQRPPPVAGWRSSPHSRSRRKRPPRSPEGRRMGTAAKGYRQSAVRGSGKPCCRAQMAAVGAWRRSGREKESGLPLSTAGGRPAGWRREKRQRGGAVRSGCTTSQWPPHRRPCPQKPPAGAMTRNSPPLRRGPRANLGHRTPSRPTRSRRVDSRIRGASSGRNSPRLSIARSAKARSILGEGLRKRGLARQLRDGTKRLIIGGEGGIRTRGRLTPTPDFESGTFGRSATSPSGANISTGTAE